jgi:hypothetical protein
LRVRIQPLVYVFFVLSAVIGISTDFWFNVKCIRDHGACIPCIENILQNFHTRDYSAISPQELWLKIAHITYRLWHSLWSSWCHKILEGLNLTLHKFPQ